MPKEVSPGNFDWKAIQNKSIYYHNEFERQIGNFLKLGFHARLGLSIEEYLSSMPRLQLPQDKSIESFSGLVIVEPRIPAQLQLMQVGFDYYVQDALVCHAKTSKNPYFTLLQANDGRDLREVQAPDENSLTIQEGAALLIAHPEVVNGPPIALFGSEIYSLEESALIQKRTPCIYRWSDQRAGIGSDFLGYLEDDGAQPATCKRIM